MTDVKTPEGRKALRELCASISKEWVPETDNEHIVLSYSENANEYQEVFEACNEQVAQAILDLKTAVPALLDALRERDAVLSEREQQIIGRNAGLIALHNSVYSLTSERDALRSRCENAEALYERERTRVAALEAVREAAQARGAGEMSDYKAKAEAVINLAWNKIPNRGHIHESVYHELRNEVAHALRDATVNGMERASRFWRYCSREGAEHNVIEAIEHERKAP